MPLRVRLSIAFVAVVLVPLAVTALVVRGASFRSLDRQYDTPLVRGRRFGSAGEVPIPVTVSIGVAMHPTHGRTGTDLLRAADTALYAAKAAGRDTYRVAASPDPVDPVDPGTDPGILANLPASPAEQS